MKRNGSKVVFCVVIVALVIFSGSQIILSFIDLVQASSNLVQLTFVEPENNPEVRRHPYYTVCPIYETSANLSNTSLDLFDVMNENARYYPDAMILGFINDQSLTWERFTTWVKMKDASKDQRDILVPCTTFNIPNNISMGQASAKVNLVLAGKELTYIEDGETTVKEFRIYIHERLGYINTFLLKGDPPHIVVPGYDRRIQRVRPQFTSFIVKKRKQENYIDNTCDQFPTDDCLEHYLQSQLGSCRIPWKLPMDKMPPCPPCLWEDQPSGNATCEEFGVQHVVGVDLLEKLPKHCGVTTNDCDECNYRSVSFVCDDNCKAFNKDDLCLNRKSLETLLSVMPRPSERSSFHDLNSHGCRLPCNYFDYEALKIEATSMKLEFVPLLHRAAIVTLELSTENVETVEQIPAKSVWGFVGNVAGNLGMLFGMSIYGVCFESMTNYDSSAKWNIYKEMSQLVLFSAAFTWTLTNYFEFNQNRIRQEIVYQEQETSIVQNPPHITLCPAYQDRILLPVSGYEDKELTFEKYTLMQERSFLLKNYQYQGTWGTKWKFYRSNVLLSQVLGQQCYTFTPGHGKLNPIVIEINWKGIEELRGYIHQEDTLQHAFMHKSSAPKFSIPFNDPAYGGVPNHYHFKVTSRAVYEYRDSNCNYQEHFTDTDCFVKHLEKEVLECRLPWDGSNNGSCHRCQFPFFYNGKEYTECTDVDAAFSWCPTAVTRNRTAIDNAWQYCQKSLSLDQCEVTCKSRQTLERLEDAFLDLTKTSARHIAKELSDIGCPFNCHYKEFSSELVLKWLDDSLAKDHLKLVFEVPVEEAGSVGNVQNDLDYLLDMFISDLGNGFGFLLGLSLLSVIRILFGALTSSFWMYFGHASHRSPSLRQAIKSLYAILKWTSVAGLVTYVTVDSVVKDFSDLITLSSKTSEAGSSFLNADMQDSELTWGFSSKLEEDSLCQYESEVGDGFCDDKANIDACTFDGGDCCRPGVDRRPNSHWFCSNCSCHSGEDHWSFSLKSGTCEMCVFPFLYESMYYNSRYMPAMSHDCIFVPDWNEHYYCATAVHKETKLFYGIPYMWPCPKEEHELHPSCFNSPSNTWTCDKPLLPDAATASTFYSDNELPEYGIDDQQDIEFPRHFRSRVEHYPWLQLHFDRNVTVARVAVTNKFDYNGFRFVNLTVSIGTTPAKVNRLSENPVCSTYDGPSATATSIVLKCDQALTGHFLVVQQSTPNSKLQLSIDEVLVCGT